MEVMALEATYHYQLEAFSTEGTLTEDIFTEDIRGEAEPNGTFHW